MPRAGAIPGPITDLAADIMFADPFSRYAELRRVAPVSTVRSRQLVGGDAYMVTRHADVVKVHSDPVFSSDSVGHGGVGGLRFRPRIVRLLTDSMVFKDDPDHRRLRNLVNKAFTPKRVQGMSDDITRIVDELLDDLARRGTVDLVEDFAVPLPLRVISRLLGIDDADRHSFHTWATTLTEAAAATNVVTAARALPTAVRMVKMFDRLATDRDRVPDDGLITAIVRAREEGDQLDHDEVVAMIFLLLLAGHDTTSNLIGSSVLALLQHPEQLAMLRDDPAPIDVAVEELLRFTTPVPCGAVRIALDDVEISGVTIPRGAKVLAMIISANHDEDVFDRPGQLDLTRHPNRHLTFGFGPHFCLGNHLARLEARAAIAALVTRFPRLRLVADAGSLRHKRTQSLRGLQSLPLHLSPASATPLQPVR